MSLVQRGEVIDVTAPTGGYDHGDIVTIGDRIGMVLESVNAGDTVGVLVEGVLELPNGAGALTQGADVHWDGTEIQETTATGRVEAGWVVEATASGDDTVKVKLKG